MSDHEEDDFSTELSDAHLEHLLEIAKTFSPTYPLTEDQLPDLNSLERAFVVHQHRLMRIDRYCDESIPRLDLQFSDLKRHLKVYRSAIPRIRRMPKKTKAVFKRCMESLVRTELAWEGLIVQLDVFNSERMCGTRGLATVLGTHETIKAVYRLQGLLKTQVIKLDKQFEESGADDGNLLLKVDKLALCKSEDTSSVVFTLLTVTCRKRGYRECFDEDATSSRGSVFVASRTCFERHVVGDTRTRFGTAGWDPALKHDGHGRRLRETNSTQSDVLLLNL